MATFRPASTPTTSESESDSKEPRVALFTHQDGKKFEVTIVRLDGAVDLTPVQGDGVTSSDPWVEEDWDSDDWDEDAEDWEEAAPFPYMSPNYQKTAHDWARSASVGLNDWRVELREDEAGQVDDWDLDLEDLDKKPPVAGLAQKLERKGRMQRQRVADVWRTRLGED
ncbi:unnamed protein product [Discula destructiva]